MNLFVQEIRERVRDLEQTAREIQTLLQGIHHQTDTENGLLIQTMDFYKFAEPKKQEKIRLISYEMVTGFRRGGGES